MEPSILQFRTNVYVLNSIDSSTLKPIRIFVFGFIYSREEVSTKTLKTVFGIGIAEFRRSLPLASSLSLKMEFAKFDGEKKTNGQRFTNLNAAVRQLEYLMNKSYGLNSIPPGANIFCTSKDLDDKTLTMDIDEFLSKYREE